MKRHISVCNSRNRIRRNTISRWMGRMLNNDEGVCLGQQEEVSIRGRFFLAESCLPNVYVHVIIAFFLIYQAQSHKHVFNYGGNNLENTSILSKGLRKLQSPKCTLINFFCKTKRSVITPPFTPSINLKKEHKVFF